MIVNDSRSDAIMVLWRWCDGSHHVGIGDTCFSHRGTVVAVLLCCTRGAGAAT